MTDSDEFYRGMKAACEGVAKKNVTGRRWDAETTKATRLINSPEEQGKDGLLKNISRLFIVSEKERKRQIPYFLTQNEKWSEQ